ncbi:MAG: PAS domain S-box protein, partial [Rectinema sp.]
MRALKEAEEIKKRKAAEAERDFLLSRLEDRVNERTAQLQAEIAQRSRVERGARANEKRIVSILESITDGFTAWDHDWRCTYVNSSAERLFKKRREDLLGKDVREVFPEAGYLFSRYEAAMNENKRVSFEEYYRPMSMWIEVRAYPAADGGFSVFFRDITEHRLAEQKVLLSEEKFSKAFYGNTAAMSITRLHDGLIIEANDRWCELLDLSREDVVGKTTIEINLWKDAGGRVQWANDLERDGVIRNREYTFLKHNNEEWTGVTSSQVGILHGERVAFNSVIDITERKRAEKALKESEQRLRRASCAGQTGLFEWNAGHDITYWSHEAYDLFGLEPDSPVDFARVISCIHPDDRQRVADTAVKVLNQARTGPDAISHKDEFRVLHKDGTVRWIESTSASELENGDMIVRGAVRDITDRKQAEENLRQSEERYRDIFEGAVEGIYQTTKEGLILRANPAFARMFGVSSPREMIDSVIDLGRQIYVDPDDRERMMTLVKHDNVEGFEAEVYRKDKSRFWMSINLHAVRDEAGNILCFEGTIIDITERKKAEAALRESEEMHRQLFDAAPDAMIVYREGRILSANALALKLYGAETIEQLQSKTLLDLIHPEYRDTVSERMRRVEAGQSVKFEEIAVVRFDGRVVPVESVANIINNHTGETVIQVIRDITERRQAEEAVRASTKKTETVLASITDMYVSYDNEWRFVDLNPVAEKLIGRTRQELIGKVLWEVFPRLRESEIHEHYLKAVRDKSTRSFEAYSPVTGRWQEFYLYPADDGLSVYLRDISDRKQMEEALRKSKDELEIKV